MKNNHFLKMKLPKYNRPPVRTAGQYFLWILAALALLGALRYRSTHAAVVGAAGYNGPTSSQPLALSADDSLLAVANPDNNSITLFDLKNNNAKVEVPVGKEPNGVALLPDGSRAYVANTVDGTVSVVAISRSPLAGNVIATLTVGTEPYGIAVTPSGGRVYVTNARSNSVSEINTNNNQVFRTINNVGPEPRGIAIDGTDDGFEIIYITQFLALPAPGKTDGSDDAKVGHVTVLSAAAGDGIIADIVLNPLADTGFKAAGDALQRIAPPATITAADLNFVTGAYPNQLNNIAVHGKYAYLPGTGASPNGPVRFDVNTQSLLAVIDTTARKDAGKTINMHRAVAAQTGTPKRFITNPWAIAFKHAADEAYVVSAASNIAVKLKVDTTGAATVQTDPTDSTRVLQIPTGSNPRGIVVNSTDKTAYIMNYVSRDVTVVDLSGAVEKVTTTLQSAALPAAGSAADKIQAGKELYFTSIGAFDAPAAGQPAITGRMSNNGWGSCGSCHPFGLTDNVVWIFPSGPKRTIPQHVDFDQTDPARSTIRALNWNAERDEEEDFELNIRAVSGGLGLIVQADGVTQEANVANMNPLPSGGRNQLKIRGIPAWDAIKAYIQFGIRAPIAPKPAAADTSDIAAGRQLFIDNNCQNCHGGAQWSSGRVRYAAPADNSTLVGGQLVAELHDVATFDSKAFNEVRANVNPAPVGAQGFQPPSLLSLFAFPQTFFHNGSSNTLDDVMNNVAHRSGGNGGTDRLADSTQRARLIKFLLSIDASTQPIAPPTPGSVRVTNAASFIDSPLASDLIAQASGNGLATQTVVNPPAFGPVIAGSTIQVLDSAGVLRLGTLANFVGPTAINFILPTGMAAGDAKLTITNSTGATFASTIRIASVAPGFFAQNSVPLSIVIRVAPDGTQSRDLGFTCTGSGCTAAPIDLSLGGDFFLELYGTGIRNRTALSAVQCTIGGTNAGAALFAGATPQFAGEDQLDIPIPASLRGRGTVPVICSVDGQNTNSVSINLK